MSDVKNYVSKAVDEMNSQAVRNTEDRVKNLVQRIFAAQGEVAEKNRKIEEWKKELKELEMPKPVTLDL